jgi:mono/diheme cytochrome c family protein
VRIVKLIGAVVAVLILSGFAFYTWAGSAVKRKLARTYTLHTVDFPIPFPLSPEEIQREHLTPDAADRLARERALERGKHLVESRYGCSACHGVNFGGGVMVDDPALGRLLAPNLTTGSGGRTAGFRPTDWDHMVRHGVKPDGTPGMMPSEDFRQMSDQELSDVVFYIRSQPAVDNVVPAPTLGPVGKVLVATGKLPLAADIIAAETTPHLLLPPETAPTVAFGRHLAGICSGCHRPDLGGGPIVGGDPSWPPAANLTLDASGPQPWTLAQFKTALQEGKRPDGTALRDPMSGIAQYAKNMTDVEVEALWSYLQSLPTVPSRK